MSSLTFYFAVLFSYGFKRLMLNDELLIPTFPSAFPAAKSYFTFH